MIRDWVAPRDDVHLKSLFVALGGRSCLRNLCPHDLRLSSSQLTVFRMGPKSAEHKEPQLRVLAPSCQSCDLLSAAGHGLGQVAGARDTRMLIVGAEDSRSRPFTSQNGPEGTDGRFNFVHSNPERASIPT